MQRNSVPKPRRALRSLGRQHLAPITEPPASPAKSSANSRRRSSGRSPRGAHHQRRGIIDPRPPPSRACRAVVVQPDCDVVLPSRATRRRSYRPPRGKNPQARILIRCLRSRRAARHERVASLRTGATAAPIVYGAAAKAVSRPLHRGRLRLPPATPSTGRGPVLMTNGRLTQRHVEVQRQLRYFVDAAAVDSLRVRIAVTSSTAPRRRPRTKHEHRSRRSTLILAFEANNPKIPHLAQDPAIVDVLNDVLDDSASSQGSWAWSETRERLMDLQDDDAVERDTMTVRHLADVMTRHGDGAVAPEGHFLAPES